MIYFHSYKDDPWLWELDWSTEDYKLKKEVVKKKPRRKAINQDVKEDSLSKIEDDKEMGRMPKEDSGGLGEVAQDRSKVALQDDGVLREVDVRVEVEDEELEKERREKEERDARVKEVMETAIRIPKVKQHMVGYPM